MQTQSDTPRCACGNEIANDLPRQHGEEQRCTACICESLSADPEQPEEN